MKNIPPQVNFVLSRLYESGFEAYLVGGCVRDHMRGVTPHDYDVCTNAHEEDVRRVFSGCKLIETGLKHGTVTLLIDSMPIELTRYRFGSSLIDDLSKRDFTVNAMAWCESSGFIDPFGGIEDIKAARIRCVGSAQERFREDPLRILRALRFAACFDMKIEPDTAEAMGVCAPLLANVAAERIRAELEKLLCSEKPSTVLDDFKHVIAAVIPEIKPMFGFEQHNIHHCHDVWIHSLAAVDNIPDEPHLRWAAFLHDIGKPHCFTLDESASGHFYGHDAESEKIAREILNRLKFDNDTKNRVLTLILRHGAQIELRDKAVKKVIRKYGADTLKDLIRLFRADTLGQSPEFFSRLEYYEELEKLTDDILTRTPCFSLKDLAVNGKDMMSLGLSGAEIGIALNRLLDAVMYEDINNDRSALLDYLSRSDI